MQPQHSTNSEYSPENQQRHDRMMALMDGARELIFDTSANTAARNFDIIKVTEGTNYQQNEGIAYFLFQGANFCIIYPNGVARVPNEEADRLVTALEEAKSLGNVTTPAPMRIDENLLQSYKRFLGALPEIPHDE
jgi:hypothetical protein